jgi:hypothetical protein
MADVTQTTALITLSQNYGGGVVRQINRKVTALRLFPIIRGEGKNLAWVAEKSGVIAAEYAEGADVADFGSDGQDSAILNWSSMRTAVHVSGLAMATSRTSATPAGNVALLGRNIINAGSALASHVNLRLFSGSGAGSPKQMTGLDAAIGSTSNTYAGIDRSVGGNAYWRPTVADPGSLQPLTLGNIREDLKNIFIACGERPDVAPCSPSVFMRVGMLFDDQRRYVSSVETARGTVKLNAGFAGIEIDGCVFIQDKDATENQIYYCNSNHVKVKVLYASDEAAMGVEPGTMLTANDGFGEVPLGIRYDVLAKTGDSTKMSAQIYAELEVTRPNTCGVRKNVAIA